jgi:hypothetical protein
MGEVYLSGGPEMRMLETISDYSSYLFNQPVMKSMRKTSTTQKARDSKANTWNECHGTIFKANRTTYEM